jgi:integrase
MKKLVYATWRTIVKDAKLPPDMSPHDCRLTHINWIEKLIPEVSRTTLKEHVGHAADGVTETNYTRPLSTAQSGLRDALERVVGKQ